MEKKLISAWLHFLLGLCLSPWQVGSSGERSERMHPRDHQYLGAVAACRGSGFTDCAALQSCRMGYKTDVAPLVAHPCGSSSHRPPHSPGRCPFIGRVHTRKVLQFALFGPDQNTMCLIWFSCSFLFTLQFSQESQDVTTN